MMQIVNHVTIRVANVVQRSTMGMSPTARMRCERTAESASRRRGFTLVELMVVVVVIALLVSILGASLAFMGQQAKEAATNATIKKIHTQLEQRVEAFDRQFGLIETSARLDPDYERAKAFVYRNFTGVSTEQLRILVRKQLSRSNFPQTFADVGLTAPAGHTAATESAEMLYYMLTEMKVGEAPPVDAGEFLASEVADTDGDGLLEFVDGWGNPLRFYRWPTRLIRPEYDINDPSADISPTIEREHYEIASLLIEGLPANTASERMFKTDPDDQMSLLVDDDPNSVSFSSSNARSTFESTFHTPNTFYLPLIVSAGADGEIGLFEPNDLSNRGYLAQPDTTKLSALTDNITNRNQRAGD